MTLLKKIKKEKKAASKNDDSFRIVIFRSIIAEAKKIDKKIKDPELLALIEDMRNYALEVLSQCESESQIASLIHRELAIYEEILPGEFTYTI